MINPHEFLLTEDHDYDAINAKNAANNIKGAAADMVLFGILKDLRKKVAKEKGLDMVVVQNPLTKTVRYTDGEDLTLDVSLELQKK